MDAETRRTLEALAVDENALCTTTVDERAAIRSALATLARLHEELGTERSRVTNLCRLITGRAADNELSNERLGEACREANRLRASESEKSRALMAIVTVALDELDYGSVPMTDAEHKSVKASAEHLCRFLSSVGNDRRALRAEIDALTQQITAPPSPCPLPDCPHDSTGCNACLRAENAALLSSLRRARAQVADLEARALPKNACLHLASGMTIEEDDGVFLVWTRDDKRATTDPLPTLADALAAAAKETT